MAMNVRTTNAMAEIRYPWYMKLRGILQADFSVNTRGLDRITVVVFRLNQAAERSKFRSVVKPFAKALDIVWLQLIAGAEMPGQIECGSGLRLPHGGRGVILNANSRIGSGVTIYHRVTLGVSGSDPRNVPTIGNDVYIGTGATIIGKVSIGDRSKIGAGAVVTKDVNPDETVVGVPARVVRKAQ